ncbi:MAG: glycoside hydrolase, partial [Ignavibacteriales bacterium]|nr:glycoside hydrolase [Ignavibacteriales bacterium]
FDFDKNGIGEPVLVWEKPFSKHRPKITVPETSDEFNRPSLGLQWQWQANGNNDWYSLIAKKGSLRLNPVQHAINAKNLWHSPNLLMQKIPAESFFLETVVDATNFPEGGRGGLIVFGLDYVFFGIKRENGKFIIIQQTCTKAETGSPEQERARQNTSTSKVYLRMEMAPGAVCNFSYSTNGKEYLPLGVPFTAKAGKWVGAKVGLVYDSEKQEGFAEFDWFRFLKK